MPIKVPVVQTGLEKSIIDAGRKAGKNLKLNLGSSAKDIKSLEQPLGRITGRADEFTKSMEAANARVLAFGASVGILNAVVQSFKSLVTTTIEVEKSLAKINSILNATAPQLDALKQQIFEIAKNTEQVFDTVADAALELSRQGLSATEVTKRLNDALILSRLSGLSAAEAVSGLTAAVNSFSKSGLTTGEVLNKISAAANKFAVSERDLIEGFKRSASVAQQAGVSIDELGGIITAVQQKTARGGAVIGNSFKTIFTRIGRAENLELLDSLGVQITDIQGKILPATKLIENLAQTLQDLDQTQVRNVSEKIGGGFQIAPLLAALSDYSSETSIAIQATQAFASATDEAYKKNEVQNLTLSAAINKTSLSVQELANALGELGVLDTFKSILDGLNSFAEGIKNVLQGDNIGSTFARGIVTGISGVLLKGGIALFAVIIGKLALDLAKFGVNSLKSFLGLNKEAEKLKAIEQQIVSTLLSDKNVRSDILNIEKSSKNVEDARLKQAQYFTGALNEQLSVLRQMQSVATSIAPSLGATIARKGGPIKRSAGGFLPVGAEQKDISRGVGGAPSGAKPVVIPNFAFGGGQKGTMVANSSEYIVPNFAGGGSAIFNQDMVKSIGLPSGAKKINAAGGFIPNFARTPSFPSGGIQGIKDANRSKFFNADGSYKSDVTRKFVENNKSDPRAKAILTKKNQGSGKGSSNLSVNGRRYGIASIGTDLKGGNETPFDIAPKPLSSFASSSSLSSPTAKALIEQGYDTISFRKVQVKSLQENELENAVEKNRNRLFDYFLQPLASYGKDLLGGSGLFKGNDLNDATKLIDTKNNKKLFSKGAEGGIFESAVDLITKGISGLPSIGDSETSPFDFEETGSASSELKKAFGFSDALKKADAKRTASTTTVGSVVGKALRDGEESSYIKSLAKRRLKSVAKKASTGYIPNFAMSPIDDAIQREKDAGVPVNQIRINQSGKLRNSQNPNGIAVTNTRDEPTGAIPNFAQTPREGFLAAQKGGSVGGSGVVAASKDLSGAFIGLSLLAGTASSAFGNFASESEGAAKRINEFASTALNVVAQLGFLKTIAPNVKLPGVDALVAAGGKQAAKIGPLLATVGKGLLRFAPAIGGTVIAVTAVNAILKSFGLDLGAVAGDLFKEFGMKVGFIDTPLEKAGKALDDFAERTRKASFDPSKAGTSVFGEAERNFRAKSLNIDPGGKSPEEIQAKITELARKQASTNFTKNNLGNIGISGVERIREAAQFENQQGRVGGFGGVSLGRVKVKSERNELLIDGETIAKDLTKKQAENIKAAEASFDSLLTSQFQRLVDPEKISKLNLETPKGQKAYDALLEKAASEFFETNKGSLQEINKVRKRLFRDFANQGFNENTISKILSNSSKTLDKGAFGSLGSSKTPEELEEGIKLETINASISKIRRKSLFDSDLQLTNLKSQVELSNQLVAASKNSTAAEKLGAQFQNEKLQSQRKLLQAQSKSTTSLLEGVTNDVVSKVGPDEKAAQAKAYSDLIQKANQQLREQGKIDVDGLVNQAKKNKLISGNTKVLERALTQANEQNTALAKQESIQLSINNITKAQTALNKIQLDQELQKEASFKRRLDLLKEGSSLEQEIANAQDDIAKAKIDSGAINGNQFSKFSATEQKADIDQKALIRNLGIEQKNIFAAAARDFYDRALQANVVLSENLRAKIEGFSTGTTSPNELGNVADEINTAFKEQNRLEKELLINKQITENKNILATITTTKLNASTVTTFGGWVTKLLNFDLGKTIRGGLASLLGLNAGGNTDNTEGVDPIDRRGDRGYGPPELASKEETRLLATVARLEKRLAELTDSPDLISGGLEISNVFAKIDLAGLKVDASLIALANSVKEAGGSLTTLANLIRNEINGIPERIAQNQFTAGTSADPSAIQSSLFSIERDQSLKESGDIQEANRSLEIKKAEFEIETAIDSVSRERLKFELEKRLSILDAYKNLAKIQKEFGKDSDQAKQAEKVVIANYKRQQSLNSKLKGALIKDAQQIGAEFDDSLVGAATNFRSSLINGLTDAITKGGDLKDVLLDAATSFLNEITKANVTSIVDSISGAIGGAFGGGGSVTKRASGGMINGGSGTKDDVPAMLMGGEYVVKKSAVQKYGPLFMDQVNNGEVPKDVQKFASGGLVNFEGPKPKDYFVPGTSFNSGKEGIQGRENLDLFSRQAYTSGSEDFIKNTGSFQAIDLEPESIRLTNFGRDPENSPLLANIQANKLEAAGLVNQYDEIKRNEEERLKAEKKAKSKALKQAIIGAVVSSVARAVIPKITSGFKNGSANSKADGGNALQNFGAGVKGAVFGAPLEGIGGLETYGGLANLFTGRGDTTYDNWADIIAKRPDSDLAQTFLETFENKKPLKALKAENLIYNPNNTIGYSGERRDRGDRRATGGYIQDSAGIDTVPTMLSGGEFVMNNAATSRIGAENLERINSGQDLEQGKESQEELVNKLEELIEATKSNTGGINITVNSDGSKEESSRNQGGGNTESEERNRRLSQEIKTQVLKIIADEKRLGGSMRDK